MFNSPFLSLVASYHLPPPPFFSVSAFQQPSIRWIGLLLALLLHMAGLMLLLDAQPEPAPLSLPQPIRVSLISATEETGKTAAIPEPVEKPTPVKPKVSKAKAIEKSKPKTTPKTAPVKPVLAAHSDTASSISVPSTEVAKPLDKALPKSNTENSTATNNHVQSNSQSAGEKGANAPQAPLTLPNLNAGYLHNPEPHYPSESRQEGEEGKVLLRVFVGVDGHAEQVVLKKSSGFARLDNAALSTVQQWRFVPAHRGAEAVSAWVVVPISFSLDE